MKIESRRLFTYPVLAEDRDDYKTCKFSATAKYSYASDATGDLTFDVNLSTDCAEINRLLARGDAEYLLHVECPATIFRRVFTQALGKFVSKIPLSLVKDKIFLATFIVLRRDVKNFSCADWNEDFDGLTFDLPKGSILAYENFPSFTLAEDPNLFRNAGSIFSVYRRLDDDAPFTFEMTEQKIKIGLNSKDFELYRRYCENPSLQPILNAMIILPVLVALFNDLKQDVQEHDSDAWFLSLSKAYARKKFDFKDLLAEEDSLALAQKVMGLPLTKSLKNISLDDAAEDS